MQNFRIERVYAGFWARAAAFVIDCVIVWFLRLGVRFALFLSFGLFSDKNPLDATLLFQYSWRDGLLYAAGALYFVLCTYYAGATLGKKALNLRVVSADSKPLTFVNVLFRETIGRFLSSFVFGLGYLLAGITVEKKALHDMLCDTRVIYAKKIPTYMNGDINKRYAYCEPSYERKETEKETEDGISVQKEAENKDSGQNTSEQNETLKENCGSNVQNGNSQTQVFRMPPVREVSTRDRKISIYDRYVHVDPDRENEKKN